MDDQSIFVSSNHNQIPTTKSSTQIRHLLDSRQSQKDVKGPYVTVYLVSKAQDLVMPRFESIEPDHALS